MKPVSILLIICACFAMITACTSSTDFNTPRSAISPQQFITTPISSTNGTSSQFLVSPPVIERYLFNNTQNNGTNAQITMIIGGRSLTYTSSVLWNNSPVSFNLVSDTQLNVFLAIPITSGTITVINPAGSSSATISFLLFSGTSNANPPAIISIQPNPAPRGATVVIMGTNFRNVVQVSFGTIPAATFTVVSETSITAVVPANASSGFVAVSTLGGNTFFQNLTILPPPILTAISPTSARRGTTVSLTGSGFTGATSVRFGGVNAASFIVISDTRIDAVVGDGTTGNISVVTPGGTASLAGFTYISPITITSFSPLSARSGTTVSIYGSGFTGVIGATAVQFGGVNAQSYTVVSDTQIDAIIGTGASGNVRVSSPNGSAVVQGFTFLP